MDKIIIFDTTLRDGEQSPGATMSLKEKLAVADLLDSMGVDVIEAGFAAASPGDMACIQAISAELQNAVVCSLARGIIADIDAAAKALEKAKKPRIHTFMSTSKIHIEHQFHMSEARVLEVIDQSVRHAKSLCDDVEWSAMDATRSEIGFLAKAVDVAVKAGAQTINIPDTVGYITPEEYRTMISTLVGQFPDVIFSTHCHNDLGLATACSLAGIRGGARQVECTINGIGERAGNAAMEEIVMGLKTRQDFYKCDTAINTKRIYDISRYVSAVTGVAVQKNKAIVGANAFAHESGIHQDGMLKNKSTYEIITPESVGVTQTQLVLGKHSGRAALRNKIAEWNQYLGEEEFQQCFESFKALCDRKKQVTEEDLMAIVHDLNHSKIPQSLSLTTLQIGQPSLGAYTVRVGLVLKGKEIEAEMAGDKPLDAIFRAINKATKCEPTLTNFEAHSVSHGCDAQAEALISLEQEGKIYTGHARDTDTIMATARAYVSGISKILAQKGD